MVMRYSVIKYFTVFFVALPFPSVDLVYTNTSSQQYLLCTISTVNRLIVLPSLRWVYPIHGPYSLSSTTTTTVEALLMLDHQNTSSAGQYGCLATLTIDQINVTVTSISSYYNVTLQSKLNK